ncbi:hypothetical protein GCM10023166_19250 [Paeniglutamicibacter cryotolerans]
MFVNEKSAMGVKGQIQLGTVLGGSAKVAVFAALPGAVSDVPFDVLFPEVHPVNAKNAIAIIPINRGLGFQAPP